MSYREQFKKLRAQINSYDEEIKRLEALLKPLPIVSTILDELSAAEYLKNYKEIDKILLRVAKNKTRVIKLLRRLEEEGQRDTEKYLIFENKLHAFNIILRIEAEKNV